MLNQRVTKSCAYREADQIARQVALSRKDVKRSLLVGSETADIQANKL